MVFGFSYVVSLITPVLAARLAKASIALSDPDGIAFGRDRLNENLVAPPRVIVVPKGGPFGGRDAAHPANVPAAKVNRPRASWKAEGEVHCWGRDYGEAEYLMHEFVNSCLDVAVGQLEFMPQSWAEATNVVQAGQRVMFGFTVIIPIVDGAVPLAPPGTKVQDEGHFITQNGADTVAC